MIFDLILEDQHLHFRCIVRFIYDMITKVFHHSFIFNWNQNMIIKINTTALQGSYNFIKPLSL